MPAEDLVALILTEDHLAIRRTAGRARAIARGARAIARALGRGGRLIYVGAGTSGRLGALDAAEWPPTFGIPAARVRALVAGGATALRRAVEGAEDSAAGGGEALRKVRAGKQDVVCGITAGGRTPFVVGALREAGRAGSTRILLSANPAATVPAEIRILLPTGPEVVSGSTRMKAGIATHAVLQAMSTAAMALSGRVLGTRMVGLRATNDKLRARGRRIIADLSGVSERRAAILLRRAGGDVGASILMARLGSSLSEARALLRREGSVRAALEASEE